MVRRTAREVLDRAISEKAFQQQVVNLARLFGWRCYHTYDARRSEPGFPDLLMARPPEGGRPGRLIFAELKRATGRVSNEQRAWLMDLAEIAAQPDAQAVEVHLWRPGDFDEIRKVLAHG